MHRDADNLDSVAMIEVIVGAARSLFPRIETGYLKEVTHHVINLFEGREEGIQAADTRYHDLEHTLRATLCWARIFSGYVRHAPDPLPLTGRHFTIGLTAVLLHDSGYLRQAAENGGTGAKYTEIHERRSSELAAQWLHKRGWPEVEIMAVRHMISCTGPSAVIGSIPFSRPEYRLLGQMVCSADYLGQMSDPAYVEKLPVLFAELQESDDFKGIPLQKRRFRNVDELVALTPGFWRQNVLRKLNTECGGLCHYLREPYPEGPNWYLEQVESNLARIKEARLSSAL
jgi:hypothetical protein